MRGTGVRQLVLGRLSVAWVPALLFFSTASLAAQAPDDRPASPLERGVDPAIRPGDDFFGYANGVWLRNTEIPAGRNRWTVRNEIEIRTGQQLAQVFVDAEAAPAGSLGRKVADFRAAYADSQRIESRGLAPLQPLLDSVAALRDRKDLARFIGTDIGLDVDPLNYVLVQSSHLLGLSVEQCVHGEPANVAFLVQGGLGLADRNDYLASDTAATRKRRAYLGYITRQLSLAGFDHADRRAEAVLDLERRLAARQMGAEPSASDSNAEHHWTRPDFTRKAPGLDWEAVFVAAGLGHEAGMVAWQPGALTGLAAQIGSTPLAVWQDYYRFHLLDRYAEVLPAAFDAAANAFHQSLGAPGVTDRPARAVEVTRSGLAEAVGELYTDRWFSAAQKKRIQEVVTNVSAAFTRRVEAVEWLTPAARTIALAKLRRLYVGVGYPEHRQEFADLAIDAHDAFGNTRRLEDHNRRLVHARVGQPVDWTLWTITPQTVGALLVFQQNSYDFAAALLQPTKFDSSASLAAVYGSIGAIIGHDVSHYIDPLGADWDTTGAKRHWWSAEDLGGYTLMAAPLVRQFSAYRPFPDLAVDGARTRGENVADLAGLTAAFEAWRGVSDGMDSAAVRRGDRDFFLAWAASWRGKMRDEDLRKRVTGDDHAPDNYRIDTVRNLDAWYAAFDVKPGDKLYLAPAGRVRVW